MFVNQRTMNEGGGRSWKSMSVSRKYIDYPCQKLTWRVVCQGNGEIVDDSREGIETGALKQYM